MTLSGRPERGVKGWLLSTNGNRWFFTHTTERLDRPAVYFVWRTDFTNLAVPTVTVSVSMLRSIHTSCCPACSGFYQDSWVFTLLVTHPHDHGGNQLRLQLCKEVCNKPIPQNEWDFQKMVLIQWNCIFQDLGIFNNSGTYKNGFGRLVIKIDLSQHIDKKGRIWCAIFILSNL